MRLGKFLASAGVASRRASEELIRAGRVTVDEQVETDPARQVDGTSTVLVDGQAVRQPSQRLVYAVNKPTGVVSTARDPQGRPTVVSLVPHPPGGARLYPVGRLDIDTTGLILTNGQTTAKPAFTSTGTGSATLPSSVTTATLAGDTIVVAVTNAFNFDPIRPGAGNVGSIRLTATSGATTLGTQTFSGTTSSIPAGATTTFKLPIAGVKVSIAGTNLSATTDANGRFSFTSVPSGDIKLIADGTAATNAPGSP